MAGEIELLDLITPTHLIGHDASGVAGRVAANTFTSLQALTLAAGDLLYATAPGTLARLAKGTARQRLVMNVAATAPEWVTPVSFSAHKGGVDQTGIVSATYTQVTFGTEDWDDGGAFASNAWTPLAGKYDISAAAYSTANIVDQALHILALYKNGSLFKYLDLRYASGTGSMVLNGQAKVIASGSDVFSLWYYGGGAGNKSLSGGASDTYFQGSMI